VSRTYANWIPAVTLALTVPLHYTIDSARQLVAITGEYAAAEEWKALLGSVLTDPKWEPGFSFLRDLREATTPVDAATVIGIMEVVREFWPLLRPARAAILTPRAFDSAAFAAHALADTHALPMRMFTSYDAAVEWLGEGTK
jgi:hypothetical protein